MVQQEWNRSRHSLQRPCWLTVVHFLLLSLLSPSAIVRAQAEGQNTAADAAKNDSTDESTGNKSSETSTDASAGKAGSGESNDETSGKSVDNSTDASAGQPAEKPAEKPAKPQPTPAELADQHYREGNDAFRAGQYDQAVNELEQALQLAPENAQYHYLLGRTYLKKTNLAKAWYHIRRAAQVDPEYRDAQAAQRQMWVLFGQLGLFDVGTSSRRIKEALGTPDNDVRRGRQSRLYYGDMVFSLLDDRLHSVIDADGLDTSDARAVEAFEIPLDVKKWKVSQRIVNRTYVTVHYLPVGQNSRDWQQRVTTQRILGLRAQGVPLRTVVNQIEKQTEQRYPKAAWKEVEQNREKKDVIYEVRLPQDEQDPETPRQELGRIITGDKHFHRISYTKKGPELTFEQRALWLGQLRNAELAPLGSDKRN